MSRPRVAAAVFAALFALPACGSDDHVIGRFVDDACASESGALVCSGFERPDLDEWSDVLVVEDAHVEQTDDRAFRGKGSLHAGSTSDASTAVVAREFPAAHSGDLYLRAALYVPADLPTQTINVFFLGDFATPDPFQGVDFNLENGALSVYSPGNSPDRVTSAGRTIPRDEWFCFQVHLGLSGDAGVVEIHVNGEVALEHTGMNTLPDGGVHLLRAGIDWSSKQTEPFDFYIDDLVLSTAPVSCE